MLKNNKKANKATPFTVPDNYFAEFHEKLMQKLPAKEVVPQKEYLKIKKLTYWVRAAVITLILATATTTTYLYYENKATEMANTEMDEMIDKVFDSYIIDDYDVYCYLTDSNY